MAEVARRVVSQIPAGRIGEHEVWFWIEPNLGEAIAEEIGIGPMRGRFTALEEAGGRQADWVAVYGNNDGGLANSDDFTAELYRDGDLVATGKPNEWGPGISFNYSTTADGQPHEWKLHVTAGHLAQYMLYMY